MRYTIELPLPPKGGSKNSHAHWTVNRRQTSPYLDELRLLLRGMRSKGLLPKRFAPPITLHFEFYLFDDPRLRIVSRTTGKRTCAFYKPQDEDNARGAAWPVPDAIVREGFVEDDAARFVHVGTTTIFSRACDHRGRTCLVVHIDEEGTCPVK